MLTFIKLGGSLITDKSAPYTARKIQIKQIGFQVLTYLKTHPDEQILIGHGSGSFGHEAGKIFGTRDGASTHEEWLGFQQVWWAAHQLDQIVCELFVEIGLPVVALPASASMFTDDRAVTEWNTKPIAASLNNGLIPILFGDVIFDKQLGGTIFSTEEIFAGMLDTLKPDRILLAGKEGGVYMDFPDNKQLISKITPDTISAQMPSVKSSAEKDVTGGMAAKVIEMLELIGRQKQLEIRIFSGEEDKNIEKALNGEKLGTEIAYA